MPSAVVPATTPMRPGDVRGDDLEHAAALRVVEPRDLAGHAERGDAVDAGADEQIDDPPQAGVVEIAGRRERRRQHRIHTFELQAHPPLRRAQTDQSGKPADLRHRAQT